MVDISPLEVDAICEALAFSFTDEPQASLSLPPYPTNNPPNPLPPMGLWSSVPELQPNIWLEGTDHSQGAFPDLTSQGLEFVESREHCDGVLSLYELYNSGSFSDLFPGLEPSEERYIRENAEELLTFLNQELGGNVE